MNNPKDSGRLFMLKTLTYAYCIAVMLSAGMVFLNKMSVEAFLGLIGGLGGLVGGVQAFYFLRQDRKSEDVNNGQK